MESSDVQNLVYKDGLNIKPAPEDLNKEDLKVLTEFFSLVGMGDAESQILRCETYSELLKKRLQNAELEVKEKAKLYSTLGFFSGLFIVILLI